MRFHINPSTGRVSVCLAPSDKECKFAKDYIKLKFPINDMHFYTQEEAMRYAYENVWAQNQKKARPNSGKKYPEKLLNSYSKYHELEDIFKNNRDEGMRIVYKTEDIKLLTDVFERRLLVVEGDYDSPLMALVNPNFPMEIKDDLVNHPGLYNKQFYLELFAKRLSKKVMPFTKEQLRCLYDNTDSKEIKRAIKKTVARYGKKPKK